jgi:hypothetical protein
MVKLIFFLCRMKEVIFGNIVTEINYYYWGFHGFAQSCYVNTVT